MLKLMNSTMMPQPGLYRCIKIDEWQAKQVVESYGGNFDSFIGYPQTAEYMSKVLGVNVPVNRDIATLEDRDEILVCKLSYRVADPKTKGQEVDKNAFEWYLIKYLED